MLTYNLISISIFDFFNNYSFSFIGIGLLFWPFYFLNYRRKFRLRSNEKEVIKFDFKKEKNLPLVSGLVAAWNESENIEKFINSFQKIEYPKKELILVVGGEDDTLQKALKYENDSIKIMNQKSGDGKILSLKNGLSVVNGSVIFLTDADCVLSSESFLSLIYPIVNGDEQLTTGQVKPLKSQRRIPLVYANWTRRKVHSACRTSSYSLSLVGANYAVRKNIFEQLVHKIPDQSIGEDHHLALLAQREGLQIFDVKNSFVKTNFPENLIEYIHQQTRWNRSWLTLNYKFSNPELQPLMIGVFKSVLVAILPLLFFFIGQSAVWIWLLALLYYAVPYIDGKLKIDRLEKGNYLKFSDLLYLMIGDIAVHCVVLSQLFFTSTKNKW